MEPRKLLAEALGTACLVFFAATRTFGFGITGASDSAGVVASAPLSASSCWSSHTPSARSRAATSTRRSPSGSSWRTAYRCGRRSDPGSHFVGGLVGSALLRGLFAAAPDYSPAQVGLGANGYGSASAIGAGLGGALLAEVVLTFLFVLVVLAVTRVAAWPQLGASRSGRRSAWCT